MTRRILINGALGKMGQMAVKTLSNQPEFTVVGTCDREHDLAHEIKQTQPQIVVDFTNAESVSKNIRMMIEARVHPVIGTTGLLKADIQKLQQQCSELQLGGMIVPNFSLGAVLLMKQAQEIAKYFPNVEIIEMHHNGKQDSPSGTAIRAAELLATSRETSPTPMKNTRETIPGARGADYQSIPIHAVRLPGLVAHLEIIFGGTGETLTLRHDSIDRECFMPGLVLACKKVSALKELVYGLEHIL